MHRVPIHGDDVGVAQVPGELHLLEHTLQLLAAPFQGHGLELHQLEGTALHSLARGEQDGVIVWMGDEVPEDLVAIGPRLEGHGNDESAWVRRVSHGEVRRARRDGPSERCRACSEDSSRPVGSDSMQSPACTRRAPNSSRSASASRVEDRAWGWELLAHASGQSSTRENNARRIDTRFADPYRRAPPLTLTPLAAAGARNRRTPPSSAAPRPRGASGAWCAPSGRCAGPPPPSRTAPSAAPCPAAAMTAAR